MRSGATSSTVTTLAAAEYTATANGAAVDLRLFDMNIIQIATGLFGGTSPTVKVKVQDSSDATTWADVADVNLDGATGNAAGIALSASEELGIGYVGPKRYVRVIVSAVTGTTPTIQLCVLVTRMEPKTVPLI